MWLLPPEEIPKEEDLPRSYALLGSDYPDLVDASVEAGLQTLLEPKKVWTVHGKKVVSGGFGLWNSEVEQRTIFAGQLTTALLDQHKFPRPTFPLMTQLRVLSSVPRSSWAGVGAEVPPRDAV